MIEAYTEKTPLERTVERVAPSVVSVKVFKEVTGSIDPKSPERAQESHWAPTAEGSGFFVSKDGLIVTNRHVVSGGSQDEALVVQLDSKKKLTAEIFYIDPVRDFALLKVAGTKHEPLVIGDSDKVRRGATITIAGNPLGVGGSFSQGTVTSVPDGHEQFAFRTDADIRSGSSGGVMLNAKDEVIGINTFANLDSTGSIGGAIPINEVKVIIEHPRVFQGIQALFVQIREHREAEEPISLEQAFALALQGLDIIFKQELSSQGREVSMKEIVSDAAVQYYFRELLRPARSSRYQDALEKKFGVSFSSEPTKKGEAIG
ncbi:trypsin-like serine protease [Patescibacteria group bacterium]|nr:MAG: trypsin-like serine protease [Patescibacteria group bacterium]